MRWRRERIRWTSGLKPFRSRPWWSAASSGYGGRRDLKFWSTWVRGLSDHNLEQHRDVGREYLAQGWVEILATLDANAFDSLTGSQRAEIEMRQPHSGQGLDVEVTAELFECAIARVVDDDKGHGKFKIGGAPESLNRVHRRTIAEQRDRLASPPPQGDPDRRGQAEPQSAARTGVESLALEYRQ